MPAGKNTIVNGEAIITSTVDHVERLIKTERPVLPIDDFHTTYNINHSKQGFPFHYHPAPAPEPEVKIDSYHGRLPGNKRHPYEVKSRLF